MAAGSILAGFPFKELFAGHAVEEFFRESLKMHPHIIEEMHHIPAAIAYNRLSGAVDGYANHNSGAYSLECQVTPQ